MTPPILTSFRMTVQPDWIDYNGHMNVAYYVLAFDKATDGLLDHLGLGEGYRRATNHSIYVREAHVTYEREVKSGDPIAIATQLIDADQRRIHFFHRMTHAEAGYLAATTEILAMHVDLSVPKATPMPAQALAAIEEILIEHRRLPPPPQCGRRIGIPRHS